MTFVYDRMAYDVERLKELKQTAYEDMTADEKAEYNASKGAYNYTDLNRVEGDVADIAPTFAGASAELLAYAINLGITLDKTTNVPFDADAFSDLTIKTDWDAEDVPTKADLTRYINNALLVAKAIPVAVSGSLPDGINKLTYEGANALERYMEAVWNAYPGTMTEAKAKMDRSAAWTTSGALNCGQLNCGMY